jgi:hypothetical protein
MLDCAKWLRISIIRGTQVEADYEEIHIRVGEAEVHAKRVVAKGPKAKVRCPCEISTRSSLSDLQGPLSAICEAANMQLERLVIAAGRVAELKEHAQVKCTAARGRERRGEQATLPRGAAIAAHSITRAEQSRIGKPGVTTTAVALPLSQFPV